jgi:hypothetical protein
MTFWPAVPEHIRDSIRENPLRPRQRIPEAYVRALRALSQCGGAVRAFRRLSASEAGQ